MDRILRILLAVAIFGGGETITRPGSLNQRYGGGMKRPTSHSPLMHRPPMGDSYFSYNSGGGGPSGSYEQYNQPPAISYSRPFGLPEGLKFPSVGYTHKFPQVPPPLPPVKARYISKPYPDFVIRFKSPMYPSEVAVHNKPQLPSDGYGSGARPLAPLPPPPPLPPSYPPLPVPVYASSPPSKAPIPIYGTPPELDKQVVTVFATNQDVNVGTSYQTTNSNDPQYGFGNLNPTVSIYVPVSPQVKPALPGFGALENLGPPVLPPYATAIPHTAPIYVIDNDRLAADKLQTGSFELLPSSLESGTSQNKKDSAAAFVGLNHEPVFGSNPELGVIKPLTPDVVYTPNKPDSNENLKPMYIFGPVYFPKAEDEIARDNAESGSSNSELKSAVVAPTKCTKAKGIAVDPNCISVTDAMVDQLLSTTTPAPATEAPKNRDEEVDEDESFDGLGGRRGSGGRRRRPGGRRGILGVVETILGLDEEHDDSLPRVDDEEVETNDDEDNRDQDTDYDSKDSTAPSYRESGGKRRFKTRTRTKSKYASNNRYRTRYSDSSRDRSRPKTTTLLGENHRDEEVEEQMSPAEDKKQASAAVFQEHSEISKDPGLIISQPEENLDHQEIPPLDNDGPDPIIGPVQIGYIGPPPAGLPYNPMQPFLYPAGISPYSNGFTSNGHGFMDETVHQTNDNSATAANSGETNDAGSQQASSSVIESNSMVYGDSQPQQAHTSDLSIAPAAVLEQPVPQDVPAASITTENSDKLDNPYITSHSQAGSGERTSPTHPYTDTHSQVNGGESTAPSHSYTDTHAQASAEESTSPTSIDSDPTSNLIPYDRRYPDYSTGSILFKQQGEPLVPIVNTVQGSPNDYETEVPPKHEMITSSEGYQYHRQDTTTEDPYPTYPQTNSYPGDFETTSTAYADSLPFESTETSLQNGHSVTYDHTISSYPVTYLEPNNYESTIHYNHTESSHNSPYDDVDQDISADSSANPTSVPSLTHSLDANTIRSGAVEGLADKMEVSSDFTGNLNGYDSTGSSLSLDHSQLSPPTTLGYQNYLKETSTEPLPEVIAQNSYTAISRKPFPSFHHLRNRHRSRYQPKDKNYIPPTTYRPAYHISSSTSVQNEELTMNAIDGTASNYNSLHYDNSPVMTSTSPTLSASYRLETGKITDFPAIGEFPKHPQYGDRVIPKEKNF